MVQEHNAWEFRGGSWKRRMMAKQQKQRPQAATRRPSPSRSLSPPPTRRVSVSVQTHDAASGAISPTTVPTTTTKKPKKQVVPRSKMTADASQTSRSEESSSPQSVLPQRTPPPPTSAATTESSDIPLEYIQCILGVFGGPNNNNNATVVDLYRHVLHVPPTATERQLRIAYFRRGRQVLGTTTTSGGNAMEEISQDAKYKFQAISMAYEIVSTPAWKRQLEAAHHDLRRLLPAGAAVPNTKTTTTTHYHHRPAARRDSSILRQQDAASGGDDSVSFCSNASSKRSGERSIRWNENVEELLYKQDPDELDFKKSRHPSKDDDSLAILDNTLKRDEEKYKTKKSRKNNKAVVVQESMELAEQLEELDKSFVSGFLNKVENSLDGLEANLDDLISFVSSEQGDSSPKQQQEHEASTQATADDVSERQQHRRTKSDPSTSYEEENDTTPTKNNKTTDRSELAVRDLFANLVKPAPKVRQVQAPRYSKKKKKSGKTSPKSRPHRSFSDVEAPADELGFPQDLPTSFEQDFPVMPRKLDDSFLSVLSKLSQEEADVGNKKETEGSFPSNTNSTVSITLPEGQRDSIPSSPPTPDRASKTKCDEDFLSHLNVFVKTIAEEADKFQHEMSVFGTRVGNQVRTNVEQGKDVVLSSLSAIAITDEKVDGLLNAMKHKYRTCDETMQPHHIPSNHTY